MTTEYTAWEDDGNILDTDSKRNLEMDLGPPGKKVWADDDGSLHYSSGPLEEDQIVRIGVAILGPAFYFTDDEKALVRKIKDEFSRRGFTTPAWW